MRYLFYLQENERREEITDVVHLIQIPTHVATPKAGFAVKMSPNAMLQVPSTKQRCRRRTPSRSAPYLYHTIVRALPLCKHRSSLFQFPWLFISASVFFPSLIVHCHSTSWAIQLLFIEIHRYNFKIGSHHLSAAINSHELTHQCN